MSMGLIKQVGVILATVVILFEDWLWEPLKRLTDSLGRLPIVRNLGSFISSLSPRLAFIVFLIPIIGLLPFKMAGLWLIGTGNPVLGLSVFLAAKIIGTTTIAWLFGLTKPAILQVSWFAKAHRFVQDISTKAHAWIERQPIYRLVQQKLTEIRAAIRRYTRR